MRRRSFDSGAARSAVWQRRLVWPEHNGGRMMLEDDGGGCRRSCRKLEGECAKRAQRQT